MRALSVLLPDAVVKKGFYDENGAA